jgi:hypothetical protein
MSGRLIILRHKTWNVWNRENIEKVKRDERLHREEIELKRENERKINSELILHRFHEDGDVAEGERDINQTREIMKSKTPYEKIENEEYRKEKEEKELLEKRREGSAPWALGEGSSEFKKISPWYLEKPSEKHNQMRIGGRVLTGEQAKAALDRDLAKKHCEDPMSIYLYTSECKEDEGEVGGNGNLSQSQLVVHEPMKRKQIQNNSSLPGMAGMNTFALGQLVSSASPDQEEERSNRKKRKYEKKENKKHKKEQKKEKKKQKHRKSRRNDEKDSMSSSSSSERERRAGARSSSPYSNSLSASELALLRDRRTQREKVERTREQRLLNNL